MNTESYQAPALFNSNSGIPPSRFFLPIRNISLSNWQKAVRDFRMRRQHRDSAEAFLAERTDVGFFGSRRVHAVLFHVLGQAVALATGVRALTALERLLACNNS
jgi:hypothetical protein